MEPFSILCKSCAARLKVTKASAVGQILACPKCGTMIQVTPPAGWVAPDPPTGTSDSQISSGELGNSTGDLGGDFEDIERILAKPKPRKTALPSQRQKPEKGSTAASQLPSAVPQPRRSRSKQNPQPGRESQPDQNSQNRPSIGNSNRRQPVSTATDQAPLVTGPVLPNDQWTSGETRKRKRLVTAIVGVTGSLVLLGAIGTAIVFNLTKPKPDPVEKLAANQPLGNNEDPVARENDDGMLDDKDLTDAGPFAPTNNDADETTNINVGQNSPDVGAPPRVDVDVPGVGPAPTIADSTAVEPDNNRGQTQELSAPDAGDIAIDDPGELDPAAPVKIQIESPFAGTQPNPGGALAVEPLPKPNRPADVGMVETFESDLGDLSALLEASGKSIGEFKDLTASIRTRQIVGIPKYIMAFPDPSKLDLENQLEMTIGGIKYDSAPLAQIIRDLSAITGVPITIDGRSIAAAGKSANPNVSILISDTNLVAALTELLTPIGLSHSANLNGLTVGVFPSQAMTPATFELPGGANIDLDGKKRIIAAIQVLIDPESWARTDDPATIKINGDQIAVKCSSAAQDQIQSLLSKLNSSLILVKTPDDAIALANTMSRWELIKPSLGKAPALAHSIQLEIGSFLNRLQSTTGVSIIVDWRSVLGEGWTPQTVVPGNIREATVEDTLAELARAMDLTFIAVDESTLMITTFDQTARLVDLEVYPLGSLIPDRLAPQQLLELVSESLGVQLQSERVRYIYEPNCQCLIVSAPQQIQRQFEALVDRLERDLITPERRPDKTQQATN